jgi:hypothetical protein
MRAPRAGVPLPVEEPAAEAEEKPTAVSEEDVRGWLDLFGEEAPDPRTTEEWLDLFDEEDEEQNAATVGEDVTAPATPAPPADDGPSEKPGALSPEEVRRWLELFSEPDGG